MGGKEKRVKPRVLKGFRDYLPHLAEARLELMDRIRREAGLAGFVSVGTPALEYAETLLGPGGDETDKQVYRFTDHGERQVGLRFDLTVPFARYVAEHQGELVFPFKRLQIGDVWRGEKPQKGRYREFCQCDLDIIGVDSGAADIEILNAFRRILAGLDIGPFTIGIGHRQVLSALIGKTLPDVAKDHEPKILIAIDKLEKIGIDAVLELVGRVEGAGANGARELLSVLTTKGENGDTDIARVREVLAGDQEALSAVDRLEAMAKTLRDLAGDANHDPVRIDLAIARGLGYYTGVVFETTLDDLPGFGSICSGGRYNDLASRFTTRELPGVGGSIGLDRLLAGLEELDRLPSGGRESVFVAVAGEEARGYALGLAEMLRTAGMICHVGLSPKLANQFKHADRLGSAFVITIGQDEEERRTYSLKAMKTGEEVRGQPADGLVKDLESRFHQLSSAGA